MFLRFFYSFVWHIWSLGGAERLIVDAAMELASLGHKVHIFTSHHDKNRCFEETLSGQKSYSLNSSHAPLCPYLTDVNARYTLVRCLWYYSIWFFSSPSYLLSATCSMCILAVHVCFSLLVVYVAFIWYNTSRSGLCCHSSIEVKEVCKGIWMALIKSTAKKWSLRYMKFIPHAGCILLPFSRSLASATYNYS